MPGGNNTSTRPVSKPGTIPMIIPVQFGFSQFISFREEDL